jgi:hypothetical protein
MEVNLLAHLPCGDGQRAPFTGVETVVIFSAMISDVSISQYRRIIRHTRPLTARLQWFYSEKKFAPKVADSYL